MEKVTRYVCRNILLVATCAHVVGFSSSVAAQSAAERTRDFKGS